MYQRKVKFSVSSSISFSSYEEDYLEESQEALNDEYQGGFKKNVKSSYEDEGDTRKYPVKKPNKISKKQREVKRMYE